MQIGVVKEVHPGENRVAVTPTSTEGLIAQGFSVLVEAGAGRNASFGDDEYQKAGAVLARDPQQVWTDADVVIKVRPPGSHPMLGHEADLTHDGQVVIGLLFPAQNQEVVDKLRYRRATALALDCIPRITRAQSMDVLSSMANIAGYRAVIEAAGKFGSFFTGQSTAAGSVPPAKVLVIGAGVAGLAALGAARSLGAITRAFDTRAAVREQVESLGGEFLEVDIHEAGDGAGGYAKVMSEEFIAAEMALFLRQARDVDIVITTALIPGKPAPVLWTEEHVQAMKPGSVVVDMAAEQGGNCAVTEPGQVSEKHGVTIIGYTDLPSRMAKVSSEFFGTNVVHLCAELGGASHFVIDHDNEIIRGALVTEAGVVLWPPPTRPAKAATSHPGSDSQTAAVSASDSEQVVTQDRTIERKRPRAARPRLTVATAIVLMLGGWLYLRFGYNAAVSPATTDLVRHLTVFVLACFVGWQVIWSVTPALHTPLMSVTNAISGIIIIGGLLQADGTWSTATLVGATAVLFAAINIFGGFAVTQRMLQMFHR